MRLKHRLIRIILSMAALMGLTLTGCNADRIIFKVNQSAQDEEPSTPPVKTPGVSETTEEGTASLYFSGCSAADLWGGTLSNVVTGLHLAGETSRNLSNQAVFCIFCLTSAIILAIF